MAATMQWDEQCFEALYASNPSNNTTVEEVCHCPDPGTSHGLDPASISNTLTFANPDTLDHNQDHQILREQGDGSWLLTVASLPTKLSVVVHSTAPPCSDILDATLFEFFSNDTKSHSESESLDGTGLLLDQAPIISDGSPENKYHRATAVHVLARHDGTYEVSTIVYAEGLHNLEVRTGVDKLSGLFSNKPHLSYPI